MRPSLLICIVNYAIVVLTVLVSQSGYLKDDSPLLIRVLFYPFMIFTFFAYFPVVAGVIIGVAEMRSKPTKIISVVGTLGNLMLLIGYVIAVIILWPVLMSV